MVILNVNFQDYRNNVFDSITHFNASITFDKPWKMENFRKYTYLIELLINLKTIFIKLYPIVPNTILKYSSYLGLDKDFLDPTNLDMKLDINTNIKPVIFLNI